MRFGTQPTCRKESPWLNTFQFIQLLLEPISTPCWMRFFDLVIVVDQSLSHLQRFVTPWTAACQAPLSSTISRRLLKFLSMESVRLSNCLILCHPFSFCLQSFPASGSFPMSQLFVPGGQSIRASASVLAMNIQVDLLYDWLIWFPCSPRDSQESSATLHFKSISSLVLIFLYGPTLTSIHDYWKNHSFD